MQKPLSPLILLWMVVISLAATSCDSNAQGLNHGISPWYQYHKSATVLTFDDWSQGQSTIAIPELNARGLAATFFINSWGLYNSHADVLNAAAVGHEIANHTESHPDLRSLSFPDLIAEVATFQDSINSWVSARPCRTFAYPFGYGDGDTSTDSLIQQIVMAGHIGARGGVGPESNSYGFAQSEYDYFKIKSYLPYRNTSVAAYVDRLDQSIADGDLLVVLYHGIGNTGWEPQVPNKFLRQLDSVVSRSDRTWVTTFENALRYHKEANSASLTIIQDLPSQKIVTLTDTLSNNQVYNHPLSLWIKLGPTEIISAITQNGTLIPFTQKQDTLFFEAIPDQGQIILDKGLLPIGQAYVEFNEEETPHFQVKISPNPILDRGEIHVASEEDKLIRVSICDLRGQEVSTLHRGALEPGQYRFPVNGNTLEKGMYICKVVGMQHSLTEKFIVN